MNMLRMAFCCAVITVFAMHAMMPRDHSKKKNITYTQRSDCMLELQLASLKLQESECPDCFAQVTEDLKAFVANQFSFEARKEITVCVPYKDSEIIPLLRECGFNHHAGDNEGTIWTIRNPSHDSDVYNAMGKVHIVAVKNEEFLMYESSQTHCFEFPSRCVRRSELSVESAIALAGAVGIGVPDYRKLAMVAITQRKRIAPRNAIEYAHYYMVRVEDCTPIPAHQKSCLHYIPAEQLLDDSSDKRRLSPVVKAIIKHLDRLEPVSEIRSMVDVRQWGKELKDIDPSDIMSLHLFKS